MVFEMLQSKIAVTIVAVILIGTVIGLEEWFRSDFEGRMMDQYAGMFQETVNNVITANGDMVHTRIVFDRDMEGVYISPTVGQKTYTIQITQNTVVFKSGVHTVAKDFFGTVHTWNYYSVFGSRPFSRDLMDDMDNANHEITVDTGRSNTIGIMKIKVSDGGEDRCEVFVYLMD